MSGFIKSATSALNLPGYLFGVGSLAFAWQYFVASSPSLVPQGGVSIIPGGTYACKAHVGGTTNNDFRTTIKWMRLELNKERIPHGEARVHFYDLADDPDARSMVCLKLNETSANQNGLDDAPFVPPSMVVYDMPATLGKSWHIHQTEDERLKLVGLASALRSKQYYNSSVHPPVEGESKEVPSYAGAPGVLQANSQGMIFSVPTQHFDMYAVPSPEFEWPDETVSKDLKVAFEAFTETGSPEWQKEYQANKQ